MSTSTDFDERSASHEMAESYTIANGLKVAPMRSLKDFLSEKSSYERPPVSNLNHWNNRVVSNLLYYQTNYFALLISFLVLYSFCFGQEFALGMFAISLITGSAVFTVSPNPRFHAMRREYPLITLGSIVVSFYLFMCFLASVFVVITGVFLPLFIILAHSSCRLRSPCNKMNKLFERLGIRETIMGKLLDAMDITIKN